MVESAAAKQQKGKTSFRLNGKLTLTANDTSITLPLVISSLSFVSDIKRSLEQVGSGYEKLKVKVAKQLAKQVENLKRKQADPAHEQVSSDSEEEVKKEEVESPVGNEEWEKKRHRRTKEDIEKEVLLMGDLYGILQLEHLTCEAGDGDIKAAYRKLALMYHPDKIGENITESDKEIWLKIQNAYETLIDKDKRKRYDSSLPFNDVIPSEADIIDITIEAFYALFEPVFKRNALFAKKKPVPNIGEDSTPLDVVFKFYKYWDNFETWRDFSQFDEYDVREAGDRYERRYMEKENKKQGDKHMKKERIRLTKLVELAYKADPRIKRQKEEEELEKARKKQEVRDRKALQRKEIEDRDKAVEDAKQKEVDLKLGEEKRIKDERLKETLRRRESVKQLAIVCESRIPDGCKFDKYWVAEFVKKIKTIEQIDTYVQRLRDFNPKRTSEEFKEEIQCIISESQGNFEHLKKQVEKLEESKKVEEAKKGDWTAEELSLLTKAIIKYPGAIPNRWKVITDFIGTDKNQK